MTRQDFVREMKESLAEQKRKADQNQREKLHDADVINKQGLKQWDDLLLEVTAVRGNFRGERASNLELA